MLANNPATVLFVDLNNHARYPTLPVGLMTAVLREAGHPVELLSPLAVGVSGRVRDQRAPLWGYWDERLRWWSARTATPGVRRLRDWIDRVSSPSSGAGAARILDEFEQALSRGPNVVLVSAYYMYEEAVRAIAARCARVRVPLVIGGPGFTNRAARDSWLGMHGVTALVAGECEPYLAALVADAAAGRDLSRYPGCSVPGQPAAPAPPLRDLDALPIPDYDDFPWDRYPSRVITILTGRGCGWGVCTFCSDVITANGRSFRSRSAANVLAELRSHFQRYGVRLFHFSDLKLNSDLDLWRGLIEGFRDAVPGGLWTCSVHVGGKGDQGLGLADLRAARAAGLVRITTGIETGSQRLLDAMAKGMRVEALAEFLQDSHEAGISVRTSMFTGFPGEGPSDLEASAKLLEDYETQVDRVHLSRFLILPGTPVAEEIEERPEQYPELRASFGEARVNALDHADTRIDERAYRHSLHRLLRVVQRINRRPLPAFAQPLEGAM